MNLKQPLAGMRDALSLSTTLPAFALSFPLFQSSYLLGAASLGLAAAGGAMAAKPRVEKALSKVDLDKKEGFIHKSDPVYEDNENSIHVGYTKDNHEKVVIPYGFFMRHFALVGGSGVGKTTLGMYLLWQQMVKGGGFIFIDAKIDTDTRDALGYYAKVCGREDELQVINVDNPAESNTYNPLLSGDADEVASRLLNLLPASEDNAGADFYRQTVYQALLALVGALQKARLRYTFEDLVIMLQSGAAMQYIMNQLKAVEAAESPGAPPSSERRTFEIFLDKYRKGGKAGGEIDTAKMKEAFGGMTGRAAAFSQGKFGLVFNHYCPEVDLTDIMLNNKMLYVMLPTMGKDTAALNLGKMLMSDLRTAVYNLQATTKANRPWPPFIVFADEMGSYVMPGIARLFEQARSAQVALLPGFQAFGNLEAVGSDFKDIILQNTWSKSLYRSGSNASSAEASEIIGEVTKYQYTFTNSSGSGESAPGNTINPEFSGSENESEGVSFKEAREARVTAEQLSSLGIGESIIMIGPRMYHCIVPRLTTPIDDEEEGQDRHPDLVFRPLKRKMTMPKGWRGLEFAKNYKLFIMDVDSMDEEPVSGSPRDNKEEQRKGDRK